jgi:hypothetical protein
MPSIERAPKPGRTKRGGGEGAKLDLSIYYYRSPDGHAPDFGTFYGRDEEGRWELHFEGSEELERQFDRVIESVREVATEAREANADTRDATRTVWLKAIGAANWPAEEIWWDERERGAGVNFPFRPRSIEPDDLLVIYAAGTGNIVGVLRVTSPWRWEGKEERWPWRMDTEIVVALPLSEGKPLHGISDERQIAKSIRQKSHIKLSDKEAKAALAALGA